MIRFKANSFFTILFLLLFGAVPPLLAQENQNFNGPYKVGNYAGKANFDYRISNTDTILNGAFQLQHSNLDALLKKQDTTFSFKGNFNNNYPEGNWNFQFGNFKTDSLTELVGLQYQLKISGVQEEALGTLKKGKPDGEWLYTVNQIKDSEIDHIRFKSSIVFENGIPQKSFKITTENGTLVGRFLRDGVAHDEWVYYIDNQPGTSESWVFNNGILEKVILDKNNERQEILVFETKSSNTKTIQLDQGYLNILALKSKTLDTSVSFNKGIRAVLLQNHKYYKNIDAILNTLGKSTFLPEFKVKVPHFPLSANESAQLDSISTLIQNASVISDSYLNDTQLHILKASDEEVNYAYNALTAINDIYLQPLTKVNNYHQQAVFEFIDRKTIISQLWPNGFPSKEIAIKESPNKPFIGSSEAKYNFNGQSLETVHQIASYATESIASIKDVLEGKLAHTKREQELVSVEEAMVTQINRLNTLIDSVGNSRSKKHINALKNIRLVANENLGTYSNISDKEEKLAQGKQLISCFTDLQQLEDAVIQLSQQQQEIEELYQDQIWNPFMANLMTDDVKKRITTAYNKVVLPHLLESTSENLDCSNAKSIAQLFTNSHKRMIELRDMDTRKLERKLKKEQEPSAVMQLLNITKVTSAE